MNIDFWLERWQSGRIGFHEGEVNAALRRFAERLRPPGEAAEGAVLVPLCGKTRDLAFLRAAFARVLGVEFVVEAAEGFFAEAGLEASRTDTAHGPRLEAGGIAIWSADFLALEPEAVGSLDAVYDRAALIALPPETRPLYVAQVARLLRPGARGLLVTLVYDQTLTPGPPFSVTDAEVERLYAPWFDLVRLADEPARGSAALEGREVRSSVFGLERR